jgi:hypothetical protein
MQPLPLLLLLLLLGCLVGLPGAAGFGPSYVKYAHISMLFSRDFLISPLFLSVEPLQTVDFFFLFLR